MLFKQTTVWPKVHSSVTKSTQEAAEEACSGITLVCGLLPPRLLLHTWRRAREYLRVSKAASPSRLCAVAATEPGLKGRKRIPDRLYRKCDPILSLNQHSLNSPDINHLMGGAEGELGVGCSIQGHWTCTECVRQLNFPFSTVSAKE